MAFMFLQACLRGIWILPQLLSSAGISSMCGYHPRSLLFDPWPALSTLKLDGTEECLLNSRSSCHAISWWSSQSAMFSTSAHSHCRIWQMYSSKPPPLLRCLWVAGMPLARLGSSGLSVKLQVGARLPPERLSLLRLAAWVLQRGCKRASPQRNVFSDLRYCRGC